MGTIMLVKLCEISDKFSTHVKEKKTVLREIFMVGGHNLSQSCLDRESQS
jgi:hypothetical protein